VGLGLGNVFQIGKAHNGFLHLRSYFSFAKYWLRLAVRARTAGRRRSATFTQVTTVVAGASEGECCDQEKKNGEGAKCF
jgi:hypothetical protein